MNILVPFEWFMEKAGTTLDALEKLESRPSPRGYDSLQGWIDENTFARCLHYGTTEFMEAPLPLKDGKVEVRITAFSATAEFWQDCMGVSWSIRFAQLTHEEVKSELGIDLKEIIDWSDPVEGGGSFGSSGFGRFNENR